MDSHTTWISTKLLRRKTKKRFIGNFSKVQKITLPHSLKTADQVIFTFSAVFYSKGEENIAAIICYNGLMKSGSCKKKREKEKAMAKKIK